MVHILAHHNNDKYAKEKPKNITHTSLSTHQGLNSMKLYTVENANKTNETLLTSCKIWNFSGEISGFALYTTKCISKNIVRNQIEETQLASPFIPSNQFIAFINQANHMMVSISQIIIGNFITPNQGITNSVSPTPETKNTKHITSICMSTLSFTLTFLKASIVVIIPSMIAPIKREYIFLSKKYCGKNTAILAKNPIIITTHWI